MELGYWIFWLILGVVLIVAEIFTLGFFLFWFGVGALAAAFAGFLGLGVGIQVLVFAAVSLILTFLSRRIFSDFYSHNETNKFKTAIDNLPGQIGVVVGLSRGALKAGEVKVYGSTWTALPADNRELVEGEKVEVVRVEGSTIYVRPVGHQLGDWRGEP